MRITWKDAVMTVSAGAAVVLERAYYNNYDWPLMTSIRWVVTGLAILGLITLVAGFAFDRASSEGWDVTGIILGVGLAVLTILGLTYAITDYIALLMVANVAIWAVAAWHHLIESPTARGRPVALQ